MRCDAITVWYENIVYNDALKVNTLNDFKHFIKVRYSFKHLLPPEKIDNESLDVVKHLLMSN